MSAVFPHEPLLGQGGPLAVKPPPPRHWLYKITRLDVAATQQPPLDNTPPPRVLDQELTSALLQEAQSHMVNEVG